MADGRIDPLDVGALERSVNDSATRVSAIWLSFVAFSAYLAATAANISHRQLFLEDTIKLPTINIDLPLVASAILLPLLFVIYHVYVLLQVVLLARTAAAYNEAIQRAAPDTADSTLVRQRLANTLFAQLFAGSPREREGVLGWLLRAMTWITLAIAPVFVLIVFELRFLPYHSALVTWTHRGLITLDLLAILLLWAGAVDVRRDIALRSLVRDWKTALGAAVIVLAACCVLTFPGEYGRFWTAYLPASDMSEGEVDECRIPWVFGVAGLGYDRLALRGEDFVDDDKLKRVQAVAAENGQKAYGSERTRIFRGRDLRCGRFSGADQRHLDISEADLTGAVLRGARLEGATFPGALLDGAVLDGAQLQEAFFGTSNELAEARAVIKKSADDQNQGLAAVTPTEPSDKNLGPARLPKAVLQNAQLRGAHLKGANLREANLLRAQLQEGHLENADLRGASLKNAFLREASLQNAKLQGASLQSAQMQGASFDAASMQGVSLANARMEGASFDDATLHGALFYGTYMQGATFRRTQFHASTFRSARTEGALFEDAHLQGTQFQQLPLRYAVVTGSYLWHPGQFACDATHVVNPIFENVLSVHRQRSNLVKIPADEKTIADFIASTLEDVPETSSAVPEFSKSKLRAELNARLGGPAADGPTPGERAWRKCLEDSEARTQKGFGELTSRLVRYLCSPFDRNRIVTTMVEAWTSDGLSDTPVAKALAQAMTEDDEKCPGGRRLNEATKERLRRVLSPGE
jgi:uncharacterized protein YjbI with pentapeptide repeats